MKTPSERLDALEERVEKLERERLGAVTAAYIAADAALRALRDNKIIQGVHYRIAEEMMQQSIKEALAIYPDLLDAVAWHCFPSKWRRQDA